jgi:uncharacterized membrane protein (DUF485 family)
MAEYQPGVCNIGESEQRRRYALGALASLATLALVVGVVAFQYPTWYLLASVVPLIGVAEGFFQARFNFCAGFALAGIYDVSADGGERREVTDETDRRADRKRARQIHAYSVGTALAGTVVIYAVGLLVG